MKTAIMQPYFLPYIGYFQLIHSVDTIVLYDNIKYTKRGWINRNRLLLNGQASTFTLPLQKASDSLAIAERYIAEDGNIGKIMGKFKGAYNRAPYFSIGMQLVEDVLNCEERNLFLYLLHSITTTCRFLDITTSIETSSHVDIDHKLKAKDKVIAICKALDTTVYINPIGGKELYSKSEFLSNGMTLQFVQSSSVTYEQFGNEFVPWLTIVDLVMFNPLDKVKNWIASSYELV